VTSGFVLDLATLPRGASRALLESEAVELGLPVGQWPWKVHAELDLDLSGEQISVRGKLVAVAQLECVRCLRDFELPLQVPFEAYAERSGSGRRSGDEAVLERDRFMLFHDGRRLDLREHARETLLLEIPMAPRCRELCRGLCPRCGADLNEAPCSCQD